VKSFLIVLFLFFATASGAQTVTIPDDAARWFLEQNEKRKVLEDRVVNLKADITLLEQMVTADSAIIKTYVNDSTTHSKQLLLKNKELEITNNAIEDLNKEVKKQKRQKTGAFVGAGIILILSLIHGGG